LPLAANQPFIVRRDHRIVAGFAKKALAEEWAQMRSFNDEFALHRAHGGSDRRRISGRGNSAMSNRLSGTSRKDR
jgi:hypothetical protein